jgi:hypothetical protein
MNQKMFSVSMILFVLISILLVSCGTPAAPETTPTNELTDTPVPAQPTDQPTPIPPTATPTATLVPPTETPVPPTETPVPPTETPVPPTKTPTFTVIPPSETPEPTKDLPEVPVTTWEDMIGTWKPEQYGMFTTKYLADGIAQLIDNKGLVVETGVCSLDGDVVSCSSDYCAKADAYTGTVTFYTCIGKYRVFITKDGDIPVRLRFELIEDENQNRAGILTIRPWVWVEE